jgi:hypothetical protein
MYIIDLQIKSFEFKRAVDTNSIIKCVEEIPNVLNKIKKDYPIKFEEDDVRVLKIKYYV